MILLVNNVQKMDLETKQTSHCEMTGNSHKTMSAQEKPKRRKKKDCKHCQARKNLTCSRELQRNDCSIFNISSESEWMKINSIYGDQKKKSLPSPVPNDEKRPPSGSRACLRPSTVTLLILSLLVIGALALYVVFEPQQVTTLKQYFHAEEPNTKNLSLSDSLLSEIRATDVSNLLDNRANYSCECREDEVCVAVPGEDFPDCRTIIDLDDVSGCGGQCTNDTECQKINSRSFRCVEREECLDDEWRCLNGMCIPLATRCDGHRNCYDHSDEENCSCDLNLHFQCGNKTSCLSLDVRCDGKIDCWDATDEMNCSSACPLKNEFTCSNGDCISQSRYCDGFSDCADASDEPHGCEGRCNKLEFTCRNGRCIAKGFRCNGSDDCGDESDEKYCRH